MPAGQVGAWQLDAALTSSPLPGKAFIGSISLELWQLTAKRPLIEARVLTLPLWSASTHRSRNVCVSPGGTGTKNSP